MCDKNKEHVDEEFRFVNSGFVGYFSSGQGHTIAVPATIQQTTTDGAAVENARERNQNQRSDHPVKDSISDIWGRVLEGDQAAWEELVTRFAALVYAVATKSGLAVSDAEDCAQQVWMTLYSGRERIQQPQSLPAWLVSTTRRKAARIIRRRTTAGRVREQIESHASEEPPDESIMRLQRRAQLELALEQLDDRCRKLMHAIFFADSVKSYQELARDLGMPVNSLGPTRVRCLQKLKKILEDFDL